MIRQAPVTYGGEWDTAVTYQPRVLVLADGVPYLSVALTLGDPPASTPASWQVMGGGPVLHIGPSAPTDGSVFWYDTDETC